MKPSVLVTRIEACWNWRLEHAFRHHVLHISPSTSWPPAPDGNVSIVMSITVRRALNEAHAVIRREACWGVGHQCGLGLPSVFAGEIPGAKSLDHPVRCGAGLWSDGGEHQSVANSQFMAADGSSGNSFQLVRLLDFYSWRETTPTLGENMENCLVEVGLRPSRRGIGKYIFSVYRLHCAYTKTG